MKKLLIALFILGVGGSIIGYGFFEARRLLAGPLVTVTAPRDGSCVANSLVVIEGEVHNISFLTINDKTVLTDEAGHFTNKLAPPPGTTVVTVEGTDRFGRNTSSEVHITKLDSCPIT